MKKSEIKVEWIGIILLVIFLIAIISLLPLFLSANLSTQNIFCQITVQPRSLINSIFTKGILRGIASWDILGNNAASRMIPLYCYTEEVVIDESSRIDPSVQLANHISTCWNQFGAGTLDPIFPEMNFLCSKVIFTSDDPEVYIDLMKVYKILYFNETGFSDLDTEVSEGGLDVYNPLRFCLSEYSSPTQTTLNRNLITYRNEIIIGKIINQPQDFIITDSFELASSNKELLNQSSACLSFKESSVNIFRLNNALITAWNSSYIKRCNLSCDDAECTEKCFNESKSFIARISEVMTNISLGLRGENISTIIYDGIFYIKYYDFPGWTLEKQEEFLTFSQTGNLIYPGSNVWDSSSPDPISGGNKHDYIIISYQTDSSAYFKDKKESGD